VRTVELRVICEGQTEYNFVNQVLAPHLRLLAVHARPENLGGGVKKFERFRKAIKAEVGRSRPHQFVTTMIDLYALPDYPGAPRAEGLKGAERASRIEETMAQEMNSSQFLPYIQVHEFEALVFVDLELLPSAFPDGLAKGTLEAIKRSVGSLDPEDINDGPATAPSKRLIQAIPEWSKPIVGPELAGKIGLPRLRQVCPHFDAWVGQLERLASRR
jgi:hypothetical protein